MRPGQSVSKTRAARKSGLEPPAKSLASERKEVGTKEQYDSIMSLLEGNQAAADAKATKQALKKLHKAGFGY